MAASVTKATNARDHGPTVPAASPASPVALATPVRVRENPVVSAVAPVAGHRRDPHPPTAGRPHDPHGPAALADPGDSDAPLAARPVWRRRWRRRVPRFVGCRRAFGGRRSCASSRRCGRLRRVGRLIAEVARIEVARIDRRGLRGRCQHRHWPRTVAVVDEALAVDVGRSLLVAGLARIGGRPGRFRRSLRNTARHARAGAVVRCRRWFLELRNCDCRRTRLDRTTVPRVERQQAAHAKYRADHGRNGSYPEQPSELG